MIQSGKKLLLYFLDVVGLLMTLSQCNLLAAIRGWLVRRCSGDIGWLKSGGTKVLIGLYPHSNPLTVSIYLLKSHCCVLLLIWLLTNCADK